MQNCNWITLRAVITRQFNYIIFNDITIRNSVKLILSYTVHTGARWCVCWSSWKAWNGSFLILLDDCKILIARFLASQVDRVLHCATGCVEIVIDHDLWSNSNLTVPNFWKAKLSRESSFEEIRENSCARWKLKTGCVERCRSWRALLNFSTVHL